MTRAWPLLALVAACDPAGFEDLRGQAWSDSNGLPDGVESAVYPTAMQPLSTGRSGLHVVIAGSEPASLATVSYDPEGSYEARGSAITGVDAAVQPVLATVVDPTAGDPGFVAAGGLGTGKIQIFDARSGAEGPMLVATIDAAACGGAGVDLGRAMVWTRTDLGNPSPDLIAVSGRDLIAFPDLAPGASSPPCVRCSAGPKDVVALAAANVLSDTRAELLLTRHDPLGTANAEIPFFRASAIQLDDQGTCFATQSSSYLPGSTPDYGAMVVAGDLEDDGNAEVVSLIPSLGVLDVFPDVTGSGPSGPTYAVSGTNASPAFGTAYAIGDLDDDGRDGVVGDPDASPRGVTAAGALYVFGSGEQLGLSERALVDSASSSRDQHLGRVVTVAPFVGPSRNHDLIITGGDGRVFVFFRALPTSVDPRL